MPQAPRLSLPDLVVLSMLAERPMHGYELWAELVRRHVWKWAAVSRPQVYYSLKKLLARKYVTAAGDGASDEDPSLGPERRVLAPTTAGRRGLADGLARSEWATQRPPPPFLTWMALSWQARPRDFVAQVERRRRFLTAQLVEDREALAAVIAETSPTSDAAMIVRLGLRQFETELVWLNEVSSRLRPGWAHRPSPTSSRSLFATRDPRLLGRNPTDRRAKSPAGKQIGPSGHPIE